MNLKQEILEVKNLAFEIYPGETPLRRSFLRRNNSTVVSSKIETQTKIVATSRIVGLICSLIPAHICLGIVRCSKPARKKTTTTSSKDVMNANKAPDTTPGKINGICILKNVRGVPAPRLCAALVKEWSKPASVAVTVITTKGVPSTA